MKFFLFNISNVLSSEFSRDNSLGLGYIKSYFEEYSKYKDIKIRILKRKVWETIQKEKPDIIGISSVTPDYPMAIKFCRQVKDSIPSIKIIIGGIHISNLPESFDPIFDVGVIGEGENIVKELLEVVHDYGMDRSQLSNIKGLVFFNGNKLVLTEKSDLIEDIDEIPIPYREGLVGGIYLQMMTSRGCPYKCNYCSSSKFWGGRIRFHSPEYVVNEILSLVKEHNAVHITIWDDLFSVNPKRLADIVQLIKNNEHDIKHITFGVAARPNLITEDICRLFKEMHVTRVSMGIESGSDTMLRKLNRGTTGEINRRAIDMLRKYFIVTGGFILGSPEETLDDLKQTHHFAINSNLNCGGIGVAVPFPNTAFWDYAVSKGMVSKDMDFSKLRLITDLKSVNESSLLLLAEDIPKGEFLRIGLSLQRHFSLLNVRSMFSKKVLTPRNIMNIIQHPRVFGRFAANWVSRLVKVYTPSNRS